LGSRDQEDCSLRLAPAKIKTLSQKYPIQKRAGRVAQIVESLPIKHEALSSNPSAAKKKKKEKKLTQVF
jgi:hypothetical protein